MIVGKDMIVIIISIHFKYALTLYLEINSHLSRFCKPCLLEFRLTMALDISPAFAAGPQNFCFLLTRNVLLTVWAEPETVVCYI